jgi:nucleotide-binding universal stress UspA family protein
MVIGVAYDGRPESRNALDAARELAERTDALVRIVGVVDADLVGAPLRETFERLLAEAKASLPDDVPAKTAVLVGNTPDVLAEEEVDALLIVRAPCAGRAGAARPGVTPLRCRLLGHRFRFESAGAIMSWHCERGCGAGGTRRMRRATTPSATPAPSTDETRMTWDGAPYSWACSRFVWPAPCASGAPGGDGDARSPTRYPYGGDAPVPGSPGSPGGHRLRRP